MVEAAAQFEVAPPAKLSSKMTAGPGAVAAGAVGPKLRLFFSAVTPAATQLGALLPPSPKRLNSAVVQPFAALTALSPFLVCAVPPTVMVTLSLVALTVPLKIQLVML